MSTPGPRKSGMYMTASYAALIGLRPDDIPHVNEPNGHVGPIGDDTAKVRCKPDFESKDAEAVNGLASKIEINGRIASLAYEQALATLSETALVELASILGYYTSAARVLNVLEVPLLNGCDLAKPLAAEHKCSLTEIS